MSDITPEPAPIDTANAEAATALDMPTEGDPNASTLPDVSTLPAEAQPTAEVVPTPPSAATDLEAAHPEPLTPNTSHGPVGTTRSPFGGWLLLIPTLGIYYLFWYHNINRELRDYDPGINVSPGWAVVCLFIPIVGLISIFNTGNRIRQAQATAGVPAEASGLIGLIASLFLILDIPYYSSQLNKAWSASR